MKYYSELTKALYSTVEELTEAEYNVKKAEEAKLKAKEEAEAKAKELKENRAAAAKEVKEAFVRYQELLSEFCKKYGPFHMTFCGDDFKWFKF